MIIVDDKHTGLLHSFLCNICSRNSLFK